MEVVSAETGVDFVCWFAARRSKGAAKLVGLCYIVDWGARDGQYGLTSQLSGFLSIRERYLSILLMPFRGGIKDAS